MIYVVYPTMSLKYNYLIVGAGFAGLALAERLSTQLGKSCLIVERRNHIGGISHDKYDEAGVLIHPFGPHYFRTNSEKIKNYLSQFTDWHFVDYKILSWTDGKFWSFPVNLKTFGQMMGREHTEEEFKIYLEQKRVPIENPKNSEEAMVSQIGWELYEKFFKGYTLKQWNRSPKELDASVCRRIPIRTDRNDLYLNEKFQALPKQGYHKMFERMLTACTNTKILLDTDYREVLKEVEFQHMIYTGAIEEYFDFCFGPLPYRSLRFEHESFNANQLAQREVISGKKGFWQPAMQVNYPNDFEFTRIVEIKHATGQICENSTIIREYSEDFIQGKERFYPIPAPDAQAIYKKYEERAAAEKNVSFTGRLATYRYYNMDQVIGMALTEFEKLKQSAHS